MGGCRGAGKVPGTSEQGEKKAVEMGWVGKRMYEDCAGT